MSVMKNAGLYLYLTLTPWIAQEVAQKITLAVIRTSKKKNNLNLRIPSPKFTRVKQQWGYHRSKQTARRMVQWLVRAELTKQSDVDWQTREQNENKNKTNFSIYRLHKQIKPCKKKNKCKKWGSRGGERAYGLPRHPQLEAPGGDPKCDAAKKVAFCWSPWLVTNDVKNTYTRVCEYIYIYIHSKTHALTNRTAAILLLYT